MMEENTSSSQLHLPKRLALDASVVLAWLLADERTSQVELLMTCILAEATELIVPSILPYELVNSIKSAVAQKRISTKTAHDLLHDYHQIHLIEMPFSEPTRILEIALTHQLSAYDAAYVWVAHECMAPLCTMDAKLQKKVQGYIQLFDLKTIN